MCFWAIETRGDPMKIGVRADEIDDDDDENPTRLEPVSLSK